MSRFQITHKQAKEALAKYPTQREAAKALGVRQNALLMAYTEGPETLDEAIDCCRMLQMIISKPMRVRA